MENNKDNYRSIDTLQGIFIPAAISGIKDVWEVTERRLKDITSPTVKAAFAQHSWNLMLDLLRGMEPDNKKVLEKFKHAGITGVKIGDQVVNIDEKSVNKEAVFLVK